MMRQSLLYTLHSHEDVNEGGNVDVHADPRYFKQVYRSRYGKVRIFQIVNIDQDSKAWVADARNRVCDDDGRGWQCRGRYPPALEAVLTEKRDFQLQQHHELRSSTEQDESIEIQYFEDSFGLARPRSLDNDDDLVYLEDPSSCEYEEDNKGDVEQYVSGGNEYWADTEDTTAMWHIITSGEVRDLEVFLEISPSRAHIRYVNSISLVYLTRTFTQYHSLIEIFNFCQSLT